MALISMPPKWDTQKQRKNNAKIAEFKETGRQTGIQKKHSTRPKSRKKKRLSWDKFRTRNTQDPTKVYKIFKLISKDVKETAHIQVN
jgi:hypothetical protein